MAKPFTNTVAFTREDFEKLSIRLKELDNGWAELLVSQINLTVRQQPRYKRMGKINKKKLYNVFNNIVRDAGWKTLVYKEALRMIQAKEKEIAELKSKEI